MRRFAVLLALLVLVFSATTACDKGNPVTGPSGPDNGGSSPPPAPVPGNPPGTSLQVDTYNGDIGLDDPAVCEPYPPDTVNPGGYPSGFRVCRMFSATGIKDGFMEVAMEWSPKDPNARNQLVFYGRDFGSPGGPSSGNGPQPNGQYRVNRPIAAGQTYTFGLYVVPGGEGRSNFTLTVKYPK